MADKAYIIDQQTGTTFWGKSIEKEMANICGAFRVSKGVTPDQMREEKVNKGLDISEHTIFSYKNGRKVYSQRQNSSRWT